VHLVRHPVRAPRQSWEEATPLNAPTHATPRPDAWEADMVLVVVLQAVAVTVLLMLARGSSLLVAAVLSETVLQGARLRRRMLPTGLGVNARL
jgi:hypothetical protein